MSPDKLFSMADILQNVTNLLVLMKVYLLIFNETILVHLTKLFWSKGVLHLWKRICTFHNFKSFTLTSYSSSTLLYYYSVAAYSTMKTAPIINI